MLTNILKVGTCVNHTGHGPGVIVSHNTTKPNNYAAENLDGECVALAVSAGLGSAIVNSFYDGATYPYVIQFDSGYKDVYALTDVTAI